MFTLFVLALGFVLGFVTAIFRHKLLAVKAIFMSSVKEEIKKP